MREDLKSGNPFPDFSLPNTMNELVTLSEFMGEMPTVITFNRGNYCPKDRRQLLNYATDFQPELSVNYCKLLTVTTEARLESIEMRNGVGALWPFLSDQKRELLHELDIADESETRYGPVFIPYTFILNGDRTIHKIYNGWWYAGRPTVEEIRMDLRELLSRQPDWEYTKEWGYGSEKFLK